MADLEDLPPEMLEHVLEFLDYGTRRTCRLVSWKFKNCVNNIGISLKIDSRVAQSKDLSKAVTITEARITYLKNYDLGANEIRKWKTVIISGPVDNAWLNGRMCQTCFNLRILILHHNSLMMEDFRKTQGDAQYSFHNLTELHMMLYGNQVNVYHSLKEKYPNTSHAYLNDSDEVRARAQKNLVYFFEVIKSRVLKLLYVTVPDCEKTGGHMELWEYEPLFGFLENHRHSLETLILPSLVHDEPPVSVDHAVITNPIQLKAIKLETHYVHQQLSIHWRKLLCSQYSLEKLYISTLLPNEPLYPWLPVLTMNNAKTLTTVRLSIGSGLEDAFHETLDMHLFEATESLRSLEIHGTSQTWIRNLNVLPKKYLKKLKLYSTQIGAEFDGIQFLESFDPITLILYNVSFEGHLKDPKYIFQFTKKALRLRALDRFILLPKNSSFHRAPLVNQAHFEPWLRKFESDDFPGLLAFWMQSGWDEDNDLDYMEMLTKLWYCSNPREQPFTLPRNADSFSLRWRLRANKLWYQFLPNTNSLSQRSNNIGELRMHVTLPLERDGNNSHKQPLWWNNLGDLASYWKTHNDYVDLVFTQI